jgi:hypothetical protein
MGALHDDLVRRRQVDAHPARERREQEDLDGRVVGELVDEALTFVDFGDAGEDDPFDAEDVEHTFEDVECLGELNGQRTRRGRDMSYLRTRPARCAGRWRGRPREGRSSLPSKRREYARRSLRTL